MDQLVQILGSLLVLTAFAAAQRGALSTSSTTYLALNLVGSVVLGVLAAHERQWGFLLLETIWALVSAWGLTHRFKRPAFRQQHRGSGQREQQRCDDLAHSGQRSLRY